MRLNTGDSPPSVSPSRGRKGLWGWGQPHTSRDPFSLTLRFCNAVWNLRPFPNREKHWHGECFNKSVSRRVCARVYIYMCKFSEQALVCLKVLNLCEFTLLCKLLIERVKYNNLTCPNTIWDIQF